ncbi:MAG: protease pro-enzyme activation domain-containing protein [Terriglobales bacterium]
MRGILSLRPACQAGQVLLVVAISCLPSLAGTQPTTVCTPLAVPRIAGAINDDVRVTLEGNLHPFARAQFDQGRVDDNLPLEHIIMMLKRSPEQELALQTRIDQMHNRHSPLFHQWLSAEQVGSCYGVADRDVAALGAWLQERGFKVDAIPASRMLVIFSGTAGQLRAAFHTEIHNLNVRGEKHIANMSEPQIPAALAPVVAGFHSLNNFIAKAGGRYAGQVKRDAQSGRLGKIPGSGTVADLSDDNYYYVGPQDFYTIYNENPLLNAGIDGAGVNIAVAERSDVDTSDVTNFRAQFDLPAYPPTPNATQGGVNYLFGISGYCSDPGTTTASGDTFEASLDVQWAGAVAQKAIVNFISCASSSTSDGVDLSAMYIVNNMAGTVAAFSDSYIESEYFGGSSGEAFYVTLWEQAVAEGQTVSVCAGDEGSLVSDYGGEYGTYNLAVNEISDTIYNIAAGGTDFSDSYQTDYFSRAPASTWWSGNDTSPYESALSYVPEMTWGGKCSSDMYVSYLHNSGRTDYGTTYTPEAVCNYSYTNRDANIVQIVGGSGGVSAYNSLPTWQSVYGIGLSGNGTSTAFRNQPDFAMFASEGWWNHALLVCDSDFSSSVTCDFSSGSEFLAGGGTSFVAPQIAGMMALIVQSTGAFQGAANYTIYNLAAQEYGMPGSPNTANLASCSGSGLGAKVGATCIFRDIAGDTPNPAGGTIASDIAQPCLWTSTYTNCFESTSGDALGLSSVSHSAFVDAYQVSQGYDLATGLGSVNLANLVNNWNHVSPPFVSTTAVHANPGSVTSTGTTTLSAVVTATGRGGIAPPIGTVSFYAGSSCSGTLLGTSALVPASGCTTSCNATASLAGVTAAQLGGKGTRTVTGCFGGDGANDAPSSGSTAVLVGVTTTIVTSSLNPSTSGQSVTLTATVAPAGPPAPTGTVGFTSLGTAISGCSAVTLTSGTATCTTSTLPVGTDAIVATYSGDSNYAGSNGTFSQLVNPIPTPVQFFSVTPCRIVDTRGATGPFGGPELTAGETRSFTVPSGPCAGIPSTAVAYSLNVTIVPPAPSGYLTIWPAGEGQPSVSTLNSLDGRVKANAAIVPAGTSGAVSVYVNNASNVLLDIDGYFAASSSSSLEFYPLTPCRVADTRKADGPLGGPTLVAKTERDFPILSSTCLIPTTAQAYSLNFTVVPPATGDALEYLTVWPEGEAQPVVSTLNNFTGTIVANAAIVPAGTNGGVAVYPSDATNLVIDVNGYFAPMGTGGLQLYTITPCRVLDTRKTTGAFTGELTVAVASSACGPPGTAQGYVFNATAVPSGDLGYLTLWPDSETQPVVSTLNAEDGAITSNMAIVPNSDGKTDAYASGTTQLVLDISAYFAP